MYKKRNHCSLLRMRLSKGYIGHIDPLRQSCSHYRFPQRIAKADVQ
jgi:hypothetical protein